VPSSAPPEQRQLRFLEQPVVLTKGVAELPGDLAFSPSVARYTPPARTGMRPPKQFNSHPARPADLFSRKTRDLRNKFKDLDVTPEWFKFDEHDRRDCDYCRAELG
jgi:hypothetical protein